MERAKTRACGLVAVLTAALAAASIPAQALAEGRPAITVRGGGVGEFLDPNPCDGFQEAAPFGESDFAVGARIYENGKIHGWFFCQVKGCVALYGWFTDVLGIDRADGPGDQDGVFLLGSAVFADLTQGPDLVLDENGDPVVFQFCIELREGPGAEKEGVPEGTPLGRFFYTDEVVLLGGPAALGLDDGYDQEVVRTGSIKIDFKRAIADIPFDRVEDCPVEPLE